MKNTDLNAKVVAALAATKGSVIHLVGRITDTVFSFLGSATTALSQAGIPQIIVLSNDPARRYLLPRFHELVRLVLVDPQEPFRRLHRLANAFERVVENSGPLIVHFHGLKPSLIGVHTLRGQKNVSAMFYSPHASKSLGSRKAAGSTLLRLLRPLNGSKRQITIANASADARALEGIAKTAIEVIESPIGAAFFEAETNLSTSPLVITASRAVNALGASLFAQCAVLLHGHAEPVACKWFGTTDSESVARLSAANVTILNVTSVKLRADHFSTAWVYLAPAGTMGFPVFFAEAIAAGLSCVAWDTPNRFKERRFNDSLLTAYGANELGPA